MLSSFSKFISRPRLSLMIIQQQQQRSLASKTTSPATGDTHDKGKKNIHDPEIDASQQAGPTTQQERTTWEKKEQGLTPDTETRQERKSPNEKTETKSKPSKK